MSSRIPRRISRGEIPIPNSRLSPDEASAFARLTTNQIASIDDAILSCAAPHWQKVARVVILVEDKLVAKYPQFSYAFYAERIRLLAEQGRLESQGDLSFMRFSEVRLPHEN
jgi:hypothetical protein